LATPALATNYVLVTSAGAVGDSYDLTGMFGAANTSLAGAHYDLAMTLRPTLGFLEYVEGNTSSQGGTSAFNYPSVVSATLTINGVTVDISGSWYSQALIHPDPVITNSALSQDQLFYPPGTGSPDVFNRYVGLQHQLRSDSFEEFGIGDCSFPVCSGLFEFESFLNDDEIHNYPWIGEQKKVFLEYASGYLLPDYIRSTAVPEPGAWVLMILGFGATAAALRRRRAAIA
jgi:hypothetical protein